MNFHLLADGSRWNEEVLMDVFLKGLNDKIKDKLASRDFILSLKQLEDLVTRNDLCLIEWKKRMLF